MSDGAYESPEAAALAEWDDYPLAQCRVVEVRYTDDHTAVVITDTEPSHPMQNFTRLTESGWEYIGDGG